MKTTILIKKCKIIATPKYAPNCLNFVFGIPMHIGTRASLRRTISVNFIFPLLLVDYPNVNMYVMYLNYVCKVCMYMYMYIYMCMYVCMHVCMYVCMYPCKHVCNIFMSVKYVCICT